MTPTLADRREELRGWLADLEALRPFANRAFGEGNTDSIAFKRAWDAAWAAAAESAEKYAILVAEYRRV